VSALANGSAARRCAFAVVRRVFEQGAYADRAFTSEAAGLEPRERAFAMQLAYGTVQRRATLDHVASRLATRPLTSLDPPVLAALRLGLFQLLLLDGVAEHAAVNESVELVKLARGGGAGLVNAVLRRAAREGPAILEALDDREPAGAADVHSVPEWLAELWFRELGGEQARALLARCNEPAESALRVNTLVSDVASARARLGVPSDRAPELPEGLVLEGAFDAQSSLLWSDGAIMPQSRGSMLVARTLDPRPGARVLDLCAAPGAKTTHLAALMGDEGEIVAVERNPGRAAALERTCARMRTTCVRVEVADAAATPASGSFDRVLVDPPCSGLGTLQSRPDLRWRASPAAIVELAALQGRMLAAAAGATAPGGVLVYSVCTISRAESQDVVDGLLRERPDFSVDAPFRQLLPYRDGTDGFFIARLRRL
jgi:16S rRNA (cytosine967-C5)-methyltransferase